MHNFASMNAQTAARHCAMQLTEITSSAALTAGMGERYRRRFVRALQDLSAEGLVRCFKFDGRMHYAPLCRKGDAAFASVFALETTRPECDSGCLIWKGSTKAGEGPTLHLGQKVYVLRRVIYEHRHHTRLKRHESIRMSCECAMCIEPTHMAKQQRNFVLRGRPRPMSLRVQLAEHERARTPYALKDVKALKDRCASGELNTVQAAKLLGISAKSMSRIMRGVTWRDFRSAYQALLG